MEFLVSRGHREEDVVKRYSLDKILLYQRAGRKNQLDGVKHMAIAVRAGFGANAREFEDYLKSLTVKD